MKQVPYLPLEMLEKIFMFIKDEVELINITRALLLTKTYYFHLNSNNHLWKKLIQIHYPYYSFNATNVSTLPLFLNLLRCFPNHLNREQWNIVNYMEKLNTKNNMPLSYILSRIDPLCINVSSDIDTRLIKKLYDIDHINMSKHFVDNDIAICIPTLKWYIDVLCNVEYGCPTLKWRTAFRSFVTETFGKKVLKFLERRISPFDSRYIRVSLDEKKQIEYEIYTISLYLQECHIQGKYKPYDMFYNNIAEL